MSLQNGSEDDAHKGLILTLAKGAGISLIGRMAGRGLLLLGQIILARALGKNDYGLFTLGWTVLQISLYASPIGLPQGVIRFGSPLWGKDDTGFRRVVQQTLFLALVSALISGGILFLISPLIANVYNKPGLTFILRSTAIVLALSVLLKVIAAATRVSRRMQFSIVIEDILPALLVALAAFVFTVLLKRGIYGGEISLLLSYAISAILSVIFLMKLYPGIFKPVNWESSLFRNLASFSLPASLSGTLIILIQWSTRFILGYFRPEAEVGVYQAASQLASLSTIVLASIGAIFIPIISHLSSEGKIQQLNDLYKITTKWSLYISLPVFLVLMISPTASLSLIFGKAYADGKWLLIIMAVGQLINTATGSVAPLHVMMGYQKRLIGIMAISLAVTILLNLWWTPLWGVVGAVVGNSIGVSIANIAGLISIKQATGLFPYDRRYGKGLVATLVTLLPLLVISYLLPSGFISLVLLAAVASTLFPFMLWKLGFDNEDLQFLNAVRKRLGI